MFSALQSSQVDIVMLDTFTSASYKDILDKKFLKVRKLINTNTGYGFILSGSSNILMTDVNSLLPSKQKEIQKFLEEMESKIPVRWACLPSCNYMFKDNNRSTRTRCEICSKLTIKTPERRHWRRSVFFIVNFEHISHLVLVFVLLTLSM